MVNMGLTTLPTDILGYLAAKYLYEKDYIALLLASKFLYRLLTPLIDNKKQALQDKVKAKTKDWFQKYSTIKFRLQNYNHGMAVYIINNLLEFRYKARYRVRYLNWVTFQKDNGSYIMAVKYKSGHKDIIDIDYDFIEEFMVRYRLKGYKLVHRSY